MEPASILLTSSILLAVAAAGGLVMAGIRFAANRSPPAALALLHGFLAAAAITLLLYAAATVGLPRLALIAVALFLAAAGRCWSGITLIASKVCVAKRRMKIGPPAA